MKKYNIDPELTFLLRQEIRKTREKYLRIRLDNGFSGEDFLIANEFNKYSVSDDRIMNLKYKKKYSRKQQKINVLVNTFSQVSDFAQKAVDDASSGLFKQIGLDSLIRYKNNLENSMRKAGDLLPKYLELTRIKGTMHLIHPNLEKAILCSRNALKAMKREIKIKKYNNLGNDSGRSDEDQDFYQDETRS